jgi:GT2 family glycosyltransferase
VVVDNNSPNDSLLLLMNKYENNSKIVFLKNSENSGFAKGNNIGYSYAKNTLLAKYMVIANNDTIFKQPDFLKEVVSLFKENKYFILGPDIITLDGIHQNPYRDKIIDLTTTKKWLRNRRLWTFFLWMEKTFKIYLLSSFVHKLFQNRNNQNNADKQHEITHTNVVLQGACIVLSPYYVQKMDYAFYPETYMYCEEDILCYQCQQKHWLILYSPTLYVYHAECASTKTLYKKSIDKELFQSKNIVKSLKILLRIMRK